MGRKDYLEERPSGLPRQRQGLPRRSLMVMRKCSAFWEQNASVSRELRLLRQE